MGKKLTARQWLLRDGNLALFLLMPQLTANDNDHNNNATATTSITAAATTTNN